MNRFFVRFPGFRKKALTLSYDDGVWQDEKLIPILDSHGIKCTFNLNGGVFEGLYGGGKHRRLTKEEALSLYSTSAHEIALHGCTHPFLEQCPPGNDAWEVIHDREILEETFGRIVRGMAYPMGTFSDRLVDTLRACNVAYARTTISSHKFSMPSDWLRLPATCHHRDPELMALCDKFLKTKVIWGSQMFYLWGHSYEFDDQNNWHVIQEFCEKMGGHEEIWYATNMEIYAYWQAGQQLETSADGRRVHNPTATTIYIEANDRQLTIAPGETILL